MKKQVIQIGGYLPTTCDSAEHQAAIEVTTIVADIATASSGTADRFSFAGGSFTVEVTGEEAIKAVVDAFASEKDVTVQTLSPVQATRLLNIKRQEKADAMKSTREKNKAAANSLM